MMMRLDILGSEIRDFQGGVQAWFSEPFFPRLSQNENRGM
jgi:hypothetical protein